MDFFNIIRAEFYLLLCIVFNNKNEYFYDMCNDINHGIFSWTPAVPVIDYILKRGSDSIWLPVERYIQYGDRFGYSLPDKNRLFEFRCNLQ